MVRDNESKKGGNVVAVTKVTAEISQNSTELENISSEIWTGSLTAPRESGSHDVTVAAYDDGGDLAIESRTLKVTKWQEPKVNWTANDRFNFVDYNRIKNNLQYLHERAVELYKQFSIADMGEDILSYTAYWDVDIFNLFEKNLETINKNAYTQDFGVSQTFYPNGKFIQWDELNRIENAILSMKTMLDNQAAGLHRLPFRLGDFKEVRV